MKKTEREYFVTYGKKHVNYDDGAIFPVQLVATSKHNKRSIVKWFESENRDTLVINVHRAIKS